MESQELETLKPNEKKNRKSRKSLVRRIEDTLLQIDADIAAGNNKPSRSNLLQSKLETLRTLLEREDAEKQDAALVENEALKKEIAAFKELNVTPDEVTSLRQEHTALKSQADSAQRDAETARAEVTQKERETEGLKRNLGFCKSQTTDPLFSMRAFVVLGCDVSDDLVDGRRNAWLQMAQMFSGKQKLLDYLYTNRAKTGCESFVEYCLMRLEVEFNLRPSDCEKLFTEQDGKDRAKKFEKCQNERIEAAKRETLNAPRGIAGDREWNPEWSQPVPVPVEQAPISGSATDWSPWVKG